MNDRAKQEPSANSREGARQVRDIYIALIDEGFTEQQALEIVGRILTASLGGGSA